jgi:hypothetical protein
MKHESMSLGVMTTQQRIEEANRLREAFPRVLAKCVAQQARATEVTTDAVAAVLNAGTYKELREAMHSLDDESVAQLQWMLLLGATLVAEQLIRLTVNEDIGGN